MPYVKEIEENAKNAVNLLKALSNEKRLMIVCAISKGEKSVGELEEIVGLSQSALSQHLARLRRDKLVGTRREAQTIFYTLEDPDVRAVLECLCDIYSDCDGACTSSDARYVRREQYA
ncbi:MAG: winged helix-turn-helix transcriptional regulator [Alphaproteobacteria bacterium]|nr:winged helix-turn-helix transcriptional regulator [Alphaproteobacteria bacterium]